MSENLEIDRRTLLRRSGELATAGSIAGALSTQNADAAPNTVLGQHTVNTDRIREQGTTFRFIEQNWGTAWQDSSGVLNKVAHGAGYTLDGPAGIDLARIAAAADFGWGSWNATARVGTEFETVGNSRAPITVEVWGQYNGLLTAFVSGSSSCQAHLVLEDMNTGSENRVQLFKVGYSRVGYDRIRDTYNREFDAVLRPGNTYRMYAELRGRVGITGLGEAGCDFGPQDHDDHYGGGPSNGLNLEDFNLEPR